MTAVVIYTTPLCPYCRRAKAVLERKGVAFTEIDVMSTVGAKAEMIARAGGAKTVPQIFVDGRHIGDSDRLLHLERAGELDAILGLGPA